MTAQSRIEARGALLPVLVALVVAAGMAVAGSGAAAQPATGTLTGRVVWGLCLPSFPPPMTPTAPDQVQPDAGNDQEQPPPTGGLTLVPTTESPAVAALVAVQNTALGTRTDETGHFTLSDVPAGLYLTIAAGPAADSLAAVAVRPNVFISAEQTTDIGVLTLGGTSSLGSACRLPIEPDSTPAKPPAAPEHPPAP